MARHVRSGQFVVVIAGKYRGQKGKVLEILGERNRVRVEGIAVVVRHLPPGRDPKRKEGGKYEKLGSIHISNVQPVCPVTGKGTRVQFKKLEDGRKVRIAQRSGEQLS